MNPKEAMLTRREFLQLAGLGTGTVLLAACVPPIQPLPPGSAPETPTVKDQTKSQAVTVRTEEWGMEKESQSPYEAWYHDAKCTTAADIPEEYLTLFADSAARINTLKSALVCRASFFNTPYGSFIIADTGLDPKIIDEGKWSHPDSAGYEPVQGSIALMEARNAKGSPLEAEDLTIIYADIYGKASNVPITFSLGPLPPETPLLQGEQSRNAQQGGRTGGLVYDIHTGDPAIIRSDPLAIAQQVGNSRVLVTDTAYTNAGLGLLRVGAMMYETLRQDAGIPVYQGTPDNIPEHKLPALMTALYNRSKGIQAVTVYPVTFSPV